MTDDSSHEVLVGMREVFTLYKMPHLQLTETDTIMAESRDLENHLTNNMDGDR